VEKAQSWKQGARQILTQLHAAARLGDVLISPKRSKITRQESSTAIQIMSRTRAAAYLVGGILLAAWLASAAGVTMRPRAVPLSRQSAEAIELDAVAANVQSQASRLRERLAAAPALQPSVRNPFAFVERAPAPAPAAKAPPVTVTPPFIQRLIAEPDLVLLGVAEEGSVRTAMIGSGEELLMATEGQTVAGRYRVGKVGADAVELIDVGTGATRRLSLRSPASLP
jgi:hypothetical protein